MKRKIERIAALLLAMLLLLTGCGDPVKEIEKETAALKKEYAEAVAFYDGGEITLAESRPGFDQVYGYVEYYGYEATAEEIQSMLSGVLEALVYQEVAAKHFDTEHALTDAEIAGVKASADEEYDSMYDIAASFVKEKYASEIKSDEEREAMIQQLLVRSCMDYDSIYATLLLPTKAERMAEILGEEITAVSEEEILAAYETRISENKASYEEFSSFFELDMVIDDAAVCWVPEGYRTVKHILLIPDTEVMTAYGTALNALSEGEAALEALEEEKKTAEDDDSEEGPARSVEELEGLIASAEEETVKLEEAVKAAEQACRDAVRESTDAIYARLAAGESFDDLMAEFGQDPGMKQEPTMTSGYYVSAASQIWEPNFRNGAISLENVGDYSAEPVISGSGVHIICYTGDVPAGPVPFEQVRGKLQEEVLAEARSAHAQEIISGWVEEAKPTYDVEKFAEAFED